MKVRNWMETDPHVVSGDTLVSDVRRIFTEQRLRALPVVENGKLRGMVTRASCLRAAHFVAQTMDVNEFKYFAERLKVKDIMVRNPVTMDADDTMERCLEKGRDLRISQAPVVENGKVVGIISAKEIFNLAARVLGAWEERDGITLAPLHLGPGVIGRVADIIENAGADIRAIYPVYEQKRIRDGLGSKRRLIIRFHAENVGRVVNALKEAGFEVLDSVD